MTEGQLAALESIHGRRPVDGDYWYDARSGLYGAAGEPSAGDQGGCPMLERIRSRFGSRVADVVEACSDADVIPKPPWRRRKENYLAAIPTRSPQALLVSPADKVHNARAILADYKAIGDDLWPRFTGGREGTLWYYPSLVEAFRDRTLQPLWQSLEETVSELVSLAGAGKHA